MEERVVLYKMTKSEIDGMPISNGSIYFQTDGTAHYVYIDTGGRRTNLGIVTDTTLSLASTNAISNNAVTAKFNSVDSSVNTINNAIKSLTSNNAITTVSIVDSLPSSRNSKTLYLCKS